MPKKTPIDIYAPPPPKALPYELDLLQHNFNGLVGIPCLKGGRDREGIDCWGLFALAYREVYNIELPDHSDKYTTEMSRQDAQRIIAENKADSWFKISREAVRQGDGILMYSLGAAMHIGLCVGRRRMLHVELGGSSIIEEYTALKIWPRIVEGYRYDPPRN